MIGKTWTEGFLRGVRAARPRPAVRIRFEPSERNGKPYTIGHAEIGGQDITARVQTVAFEHKVDGSNLLTLGIVLYGEDVIDLEIPEDEIVVNGKVLRDGEMIDVTAVGDRAIKYLREPA